MLLYSLLVFLAVISRLVDHPVNVAPIMGLALFAGTTSLLQPNKSGKLVTYTLPVVALLISDAIIGFYTWQVMIAVYLSYGLALGIGFWLRDHYSLGSVIAASVVSSILFFLITNAAVWAFTPLYQQNLTGLMESYIAAIPFFRNSLLGDLLYTGVLFGAYQAAVSYRVAPAIEPARAM